ncbi:AraC family transcriptional regulator ligand-binding domain-containing protein [Lutimaribacter marinistellae]|uniref:AraC family transcriptional regulator ligand-binding domain-containing protein n=1 Tax=Lutimaribacter marinistellae TaxID=1820329 RepID=A0ABV7TNZ1_9RHOB
MTYGIKLFAVLFMSISPFDQPPEHSAIWGKLLLEELKARGFTEAQVVGNTGIDLRRLAGDDPRLLFQDLVLLFERAADLVGDDLFGFRCGTQRESRRAGLIAYVGLSAPTISDFLVNLGRYQRIIGDALEIDTTRLHSDGIWEWYYNVPHSVHRRQYIEFQVAGTVRSLRNWTNRKIRPERIELRHIRSRNTADMERYLGCEIVFGSDSNRVKISKPDLTVPLITADDELHKVLRRCCEHALQEASRYNRSLPVDVENEIARRLSSGMATQKEVAQALGMSVSTLSRRLGEYGTSFSEIALNYKRSMAKRLLKEGAMQLTEVAFLMGYQDSSAFTRAFRNWTGDPPSRYRAKH